MIGTPQSQRISEAKSIIATVLNSALQIPGTKKALAFDIEISPQYISYILSQARMPSKEVAYNIAEWLYKRGHMSLYDIQRWLHYVNEYTDLLHNPITENRLYLSQPIDKHIADIRATYYQASHEQDPVIAAQRYQATLVAAESLLPFIKNIENDAYKLHVYQALNDVYSVVGRHADALWAARRSRYIAESGNLRDAETDDNQGADYFIINTRRTEIVTLNNLKLYRQANELGKELEALSQFKKHAAFWKPHVYRDRLTTIAHLPRIALNDAKELTNQVRIINEHDQSEEALLRDILINRSYAEVLNTHGKSKQAIALLSKIHNEMTHIKPIGALYRVLVLRTYADACWNQSDKEQWRHWISQAISTAIDAKLTHQLDKMMSDYQKQPQPA